jgi:transcriptional regulator with XRE-family HTH domain
VVKSAQVSLAERLRALRVSDGAAPVTQQALATVLGVSVPSISSWEQGKSIPPLARLRDYALAFAAEGTFAADTPTMPDDNDLSAPEELRRQSLVEELITLRDGAARPAGEIEPRSDTSTGTFWRFPDGAPIRIISTRMWPDGLNGLPYADPRHPNYVQALWDADRDATIELFGHLRAENPTSDVRFLTDDQVTQDDLTGHVVVLGQGDKLLQWNQDPVYGGSPLGYVAKRLELPLGTRVPEGGDPEFDGEFIVTLDADGRAAWFDRGVAPADVDVYRPRFLRESPGPKSPRLRINGFPQLEYDVGLLVRKPNELNLATTVTVCSGVFSRGTYGAVRALTDAQLRGRNESFIVEQFGATDDFWMLFYVPVFRGSTELPTITPDLARPFHRLRSSAD